MSSEVSVIGAAAAVVAAPVVVAVAAPVVAAAAVASVAVSFFQNVGSSIGQIAQISKEERELRQKLHTQFIETNEKILSHTEKEGHIQKILDLFSKETVVDQARARELVQKGKTLDAQMQIARDLLAVQSTFAMLTGNMATLNNVCEQLGLQYPVLDGYRQLFCNAKTLSLAELQTQCTQLNQEVLAHLDSLQEIIEQQIRERKFDPQFFQVTREEADLFQAVFQTELNAFINNPPNEETKILLNERNVLEYRIRALMMLHVLRKMDGFSDYADRILRLLGNIEKLSHQEDMSFEDYVYEVSLKFQSLETISRELEKKQAYTRRRRAIELQAEANRYRSLLNLPPSNETPSDDDASLQQLEREAAEWKARYERVAWAKQLSLRLKMRYERMNYQHIPSADSVDATPKTAIHRSYYVLPDQQNVLCISVCENGNVFQRVVGVKIPGLAEDKKSIYEAQLKFCQDTKSVLQEVFPDSEDAITREEPVLEFAEEEDLSMILPPTVINRVRQARQKRKTNVQQRRAIQ